MEKIVRIVTNISFLLLSAFAQGQSINWDVDPVHSSLSFSIDHLVISETIGEFSEYSADIKSDKPDFTDALFNVSIQVSSINTKDDQRDEHLRSADFFNVEEFPVITFRGKEFKKVNNNKYEVIGDLTIRDITKSVKFDGQFGGIVNDPWGGVRAGLKISGEIDRYDFGLKYNSVLEAGGLAIGQNARIECRLELVKKMSN